MQQIAGTTHTMRCSVLTAELFAYDTTRYTILTCKQKLTGVSLFCRTEPTHAHTHAHAHPFNGPLSGTTQVSRYQKGKTDLDFTETRDSEWQWHQLGHMQICTSLQTDNHASTSSLSFLQAGCPSCCPTNSVKALNEGTWNQQLKRGKTKKVKRKNGYAQKYQ